MLYNNGIQECFKALAYGLNIVYSSVKSTAVHGHNMLYSLWYIIVLAK